MLVNSTSILLTNSTEPLVSFTITNATMTVSNWATILQATTVTVQNASTITLPSAFTTSQMSNRVNMLCSNLTVEAGGKIDVTAKDYATGQGPGASLNGDLGGGGIARGAGSGGGIYLNCQTFSGSGTISAKGGDSSDQYGSSGGGADAGACSFPPGTYDSHYRTKPAAEVPGDPTPAPNISAPTLFSIQCD